MSFPPTLIGVFVVLVLRILIVQTEFQNLSIPKRKAKKRVTNVKILN